MEKYFSKRNPDSLYFFYWEYESGKKKDRPEFQKLLSLLNSGDTLVTTEVSRITISTKQLCEVMDLVQERHLCLKIGLFTVDCRDDQPDPVTNPQASLWA